MGWMVNFTARPLYPRERPGTHCTGGWVGPRAGLDRCGKSRPPPGFDPRTVQPVASRYTDYATRPTPSVKFSLNSLQVLHNKLCSERQFSENRLSECHVKGREGIHRRPVNLS